MNDLELFLVPGLIGLLLLVSFSFGEYIAKVLSGEHHILSTLFGPCESMIYKIGGVNPSQEMDWKSYTKALLCFNFLSLIFVLGLLILQGYLPLNPEGLGSVPFALALNTAISFVTNTNWQAYAGESTLTYLSQMLGLGVQNFLSAATGLAVMAAVARSLAGKESHNLGNFWADITRSTVYIFLPLSSVLALVLVSQGVVQNFLPYVDAQTLEGFLQKIPGGPAASQIAIKQLGSNGGGFFGVNSAHPFENPTALSNLFQILAILLIPFACPIAFGHLAKDTKHGKTIFYTMFCLLMISLCFAIYSELQMIPNLQIPFYEGKEVRFGVVSSVLWTVATSATSNGSVNAMISSASPVVGGLAMFNLMLGEVIFGGVGSGVYGIVLFVILTVFIAGLMVGRTPEYLGKKIESSEIKLAVIGILLPCAVILLFSALGCLTEAGLSSLSNQGPHGLSEILYAFASAAGNNGSAFGGLNANTNFYNLLTSVGMLIGRFGIIIPVLAIAGQLVKKKHTPASLGTLPTDTVLFGIMLAGVILIIGGLTFFPAISLGPIVEHILMLQGRSF